MSISENSVDHRQDLVLICLPLKDYSIHNAENTLLEIVYTYF